METKKNSFHSDDTYLHLRIYAPFQRSGWARSRIRLLGKISERVIETLATAWLKTVEGHPITTIKTSKQSLSSILAFIALEQKTLPTNTGWQEFVCDYFEFFISNQTYSQANLKTRIGTWSNSRSLLQTLINISAGGEEIIIPRTNHSNHRYKSEESTKSYVIGEKFTQPIEYTEDTAGHYLTDISYTSSKDEYLDEISKTISIRLESFMTSALKYLEVIKDQHRAGQSLMNRISDDELIRRITENDFFQENRHGEQEHILLSSNGLPWMLKYLQHFLSTSNPIPLNLRSIVKTTLFKSLNLEDKKKYLLIDDLLEPVNLAEAFEGISRSEVLAKLLGLLHSRDCACITGILIHEHPELTSSAVIDARFSSKRGKNFLFASNTRNNFIFSSTKPRAGKRIISLLSEIAKDALDLVSSSTALLRAGQKHNSPVSRMLFLTAGKDGYGPAANVRNLVKDKKNSPTLVDILQRLHPLEFDPSLITFSRIRNSRAILEWLNTGSIEAMAKRLANTPSIILRHYLPPWLLKKWNERSVRRFQQTIILLAAHQSPWLLEASDFEDQESLLQFINNLVKETISGDPLSDLILARFSPLTGVEPAETSDNMILKLSSESLYKIYKFECTVPTSVTYHESGVLSLSRLIRTTIEQSCSSQAELAIRSRLQGDSFDRIRTMHIEAVARLNSEQEVL